ncbi:MAG TPA: signal peptidase I [Firmicutes bacterium]|nr:signal peptidase I [Bacillota bacterium]
MTLFLSQYMPGASKVHHITTLLPKFNRDLPPPCYDAGVEFFSTAAGIFIFPVRILREAVLLTGSETGPGVQVTGRTEQRNITRRKAVRRAVHVAGNVLFALLLLVMCFLVFFLLQSRITGSEPSLAGYRLYIVLSDSMAPAFRAGSMVVVRPAEPGSLEAGDIITFQDPAGGANSITHRIAAVHTEGGLAFTTRGDANNTEDLEPVPAGKVIGKVTVAVPYAGYLVNWSRTKTGLLALVIVPGLLIITLELRNLLRYASEVEQKKKERKEAESRVDSKEGVQPRP